jgi:hypothetical protein
MATYGEEVEILFDTHAGLRLSPSTLHMPDDLQSSAMLSSNDRIAEIHSRTNHDLKEEPSKPTNVGLGLTFNKESRYQRYDLLVILSNTVKAVIYINVA